MPPRDSDIFADSPSTAPRRGDTDIFADLKESAPPKLERQEEPVDWKMNALKFGMFPSAAAEEGLKSVNSLIEKVAYNVGGGVTDLTGSPAAGYVSNVATQAIPAILSGQAAQKLGSPMMQSAARTLVQSAIKPDKLARESGAGTRAVNTILEEGIPTSAGGMEGVQNRVSNLNARVQSEIAGSDARVNAQDAARNLVEEIKATRNVPMSADKRNALVAKLEEFLAENPENISVQRAQQLKQGAYRDVGSRPFMATADQNVALADEAKMLVARGLKDEIAKGVPQVGKLNAEESHLLNVLKVAGPRLLTQGNQNIGGLAPLASGWQNMLFFLLDRSAAAKGLLGRALYQGSNAIPNAAGTIGGAYLMAPGSVAPGESPVLDLTSDGVLYAPPRRGAPVAMITGGTR